MKKLVAIMLLLPVIFTGCMKDKFTKTYTIYTPVYKDKAEVLASIGSHSPRELKNTGKIYLYGNYIFLNEINKGVHVIDNSDPSSPDKVAFIDIPGNLDIAVKGTTLYADLYTDLLAIDIANPLQASLTKVVPDVFPERSYTDGFVPRQDKVIVDWIVKDTTVTVSGRPGDNNWFCINCGFIRFDALANAAAAAPATGVGGSMARFAIVNNYLYTVNISSLGVHDISNTSDPQHITNRGIGWNIETIYPFKNKLFIGSSSGMHIFSISNGAEPQWEGQFNHANACDPVVADDHYAYVTLRAGTFCQGTNNQLDVIDISNIMSPSLVKTYSLHNPHGLGKDGNLLWVCDGTDGLKLFDATQANNLRQIKRIQNIEAFDVIPLSGRMIVVGKGGLYQYDYTNLDNIRLLSKLSVIQ